MADSMIVRVQRGLALDDVKIYELGDTKPIAVVPKEVATNYVDLYELLPLGSCYVIADFDEQYSNFTLRAEKIKPS